MLRNRKAEKPAVDIPKVGQGVKVPLLPAQARIWYFTRRFPESAEYNLFDVVTLAEAPDRELLTSAVRTLTQRHDALRVRILEVDGEPVQEDCGSVEPPVEWHDLRALGQEAAEARTAAIVEKTASIPLPTDEAPLFRVIALLLPDGPAVLALGFHHVIIDHWSVSQVTDELSRLLAGAELPPAHGVGYLDYAAAHARTLDETRVERELTYWKGRLGGELPVLDLPKDRPRPANETRSGEMAGFRIESELADRVRRFAADQRTSTFVVLLAAYQTFLSRLSGQTDIVVGSPLAGRDDETAEKIVGCFVKPVALRGDLSAAPDFRTLIQQTQQTVLESQDHQMVPFERIVAELGVARTPGVNPVFQTIFGFVSGIGVVSEGEGGSLVELDTKSARTDLTVSVVDAGEHLRAVMEYSSDLFNRSTVDRFAQLYVALVDTLITSPATPVTEVELLSEAGRSHILHGLNTYRKPDIRYRTLAEPFEEQVLRTPDSVALVGEEGELTYAEMNERANQLAHHLRAQGVRPGDKVAVCMDRSFAMVIALYAVAKAGAAYVPMDPDLPDGRMEFMLADTEPQLVLADDRGAGQLPGGPWTVLRVTGEERPWERCPTGNLPISTPPNALAFLLYTSGSTGRPKAVAYPVDGALANIFWLQGRYPFGPGDANILKTSYGFDVSTWELYWPLYYGSRLVVARPGGHREPEYLHGLTEQYQVTTLFFVPTMMEVFLAAAPSGSCGSLRRVIIGGEEVKPPLRDAFHAHFDAELVNCCGPTEAGTVVEGVIPREPGVPVLPLGRPCDNFRIHILGPDLEVLPIGVPGEMYIGGETGLAHGYHNRPGMTAERFLPDPFGPVGERMYRTGDLCRYREDGVIEHLGRIDRQVKVRGLRIELSEIESVLCEHPDVRACVVLAPSGFDGRIAAFVVPEPGSEPDPRELERHARNQLPTHMVPAAVVTVDQVPYNVNGKIDEKALLEHLGSRAAGGSTELVEPEGEMETRLAGVFGEVLGIERFSVTDGFFSLGGHSLLVFKLIAACARELGVKPTVGDVFAAPSVRELAARLGSAAEERTDEVLVPLVHPQGRPVVLFVHGAGGSVLPFQAVGRELGEKYDVYGLQAANVTDADGSGAGAESIEDMAARYVAAVDAVRGTRPLFLAGWSVGGCVALEMARQWQARDVDLVGVAMLDTWLPPEAVADPAAAEQARAAFAAMDLLGGEGEATADLTGISEEAARIPALMERHRAAFLGYTPEPYAGEVCLLRAAEPYPDPHIEFPAILRGADHGWRAHIPGLSSREIRGNHFSLISDENSAHLAETVHEIVDEMLSFSEI
ncbi:amino acid adenylation domain-containing protein [Streptomyces sp. NPDC051569]|uniref:amino acid adenylation domain-containing protein n=1 Tax=Streptomyces sp. NPDC051569 TaxID=3365661 RepID=UPI0037A1C2FA